MGRVLIKDGLTLSYVCSHELLRGDQHKNGENNHCKENEAGVPHRRFIVFIKELGPPPVAGSWRLS